KPHWRSHLPAPVARRSLFATADPVPAYIRDVTDRGSLHFHSLNLSFVLTDNLLHHPRMKSMRCLHPLSWDPFLPHPLLKPSNLFLPPAPHPLLRPIDCRHFQSAPPLAQLFSQLPLTERHCHHRSAPGPIHQLGSPGHQLDGLLLAHHTGHTSS